uniref:Uncharacterized protein n=1 Tax=Rhizophora mucronata TaxID=61149 RepID=A0A2P2NNV6_RHIMU
MEIEAFGAIKQAGKVVRELPKAQS